MKSKFIQLFLMLSKYVVYSMIIQCTALTFLLASTGNAQKYKSIKETYIQTDFEYTDLRSVIHYIESRTDYTFVYQGKLFKKMREEVSLSIPSTKMTVAELLTALAEESNLNFQQVNNNISVFPVNHAGKAREKIESVTTDITVRGKVTDDRGEPLPGASVIAKGSGRGTITDENGNYVLTVSDDAVLVFSFIGYHTQEIAVNGQSTINMQLSLDAKTLSEVVITGYQEIAANETTGSYSSIKTEQLDRKIRTNIRNKLEGLVPGLVLTPDQTQEGATKLDIRGVSTVQGNNGPLIVVDGFPLEGDISTINPNDVESITVLKDAAAASVYGARSANGVIVITTRKGRADDFRVDYINSFAFTPAPDLAYRLQRASTEELIGVHREAFVARPELLDGVFSVDKVFDALNRADAGEITQEEADNIIEGLSSRDNLSQLEDELLRSRFEEQHNLSLSGGSRKNTYRLSLNYVNDRLTTPTQSDDRVIVDFRNNLSINDKMSLDVGGNITFFGSEGNVISAEELFDLPGYNLLKDENDNPLAVQLGTMGESSSSLSTGGKSPAEIQRLVDLGLLDETYVPLLDFDERTFMTKSLNVRLQALLNIDLWKGLSGNVGFQYERGDNSNSRFASVDSREMKNIINNAASNPFTGDPLDFNIPVGGSLSETRGDRQSYTFRGQLNFTRSLGGGDHELNSIAGFELRRIFVSSTLVTRYGFDEESLSFQTVNAIGLQNGLATQSPSGFTVFNLNSGGSNSFAETEDRFVSFYGNLSYTFKQRYTASGSIRVDQSNLFGTDPRFRYKPLWSAGAVWHVSNESFFNLGFFDNLRLRYTYGINGNVANQQGPFTIAARDFAFRSGSLSNTVLTPPNEELRWEKTTTSNFGLDFSVLDRRLNVNVDYYRRNSRDLLSNIETDPTLGFTSLVLNQANIENRGIEVGIQSENIRSNSFQWSTYLTFRRNENEVKKVFIPDVSVNSRVRSPVIVEGHEANSLFSFQFGGLDESGNATAIKEDGETKITDFREAELPDLVHSGTVDPRFTGGITNNFSYKNLELSLLFIFSGGHVMIRDTYGGIYTPSPFAYHRDVAERWREAGDEATTNIPAVGSAPLNNTILFSRSDINVLDADYVKLRELILTYNFPDQILNRTPLKGLGLKFQVDNLFYWAKNDNGIDPEAHGLAVRFFPIEPTYTLGLRASL